MRQTPRLMCQGFSPGNAIYESPAESYHGKTDLVFKHLVLRSIWNSKCTKPSNAFEGGFLLKSWRLSSLASGSRSGHLTWGSQCDVSTQKPPGPSRPEHLEDLGWLQEWLSSVFCPKHFRAPLGGSAGRESASSTGDLGSISGLGRSPGEGKGSPLQYSGLENPMDCTVHETTKSQTRLRDFQFSSVQSTFKG